MAEVFFPLRVLSRAYAGFLRRRLMKVLSEQPHGPDEGPDDDGDYDVLIKVPAHAGQRHTAPLIGLFIVTSMSNSGLLPLLSLPVKFFGSVAPVLC